MSRIRVAVAATLAALAGVLITAAALRLDHPVRVAAGPVVNRGAVAPSTASSVPPSLSGGGRPVATATRFVAGTRLAVPRYGVDASVVAEPAPGGVLQIPLDPAVLGWWSGGAVPGSGRGAVVIAGHINYAGVSGALAILARLMPGDRVVLSRPGQASITYRVTGLRTFAKDPGLPASLFAGSGPERLIMITCGGPFDAATGNYEDNVVAYATPV